jgi:dipeptide/tripeptide permease
MSTYKQAIGRLSAGLAADEVKKRLNLPSTAVLVPSTVLMTLGHLINASSNSIGGIFAGVAICGLGFGMVWPLMVVLSGDLYGSKAHGANYRCK